MKFGLGVSGGQRRMPLLRLPLPVEPEPFMPVLIKKNDLNDIELIPQNAVDPFSIPGTRLVYRFLVLIAVVENAARLRQFCQQLHHLFAGCEMLVEITKIRAQVLQVRLVVEELHAPEDQREIQRNGGQQRRQCKQQEEKKYLGAQFHANPRNPRRLS